MIPTIVNTIAVVIGAMIGLLLHGRISERFRVILFQAIGLSTLVIGLRDSLATNHIPILALSVIMGALTGEALNIEARLEQLGAFLKRLLRHEGRFAIHRWFCVLQSALLRRRDDGCWNLARGC